MEAETDGWGGGDEDGFGGGFEESSPGREDAGAAGGFEAEEQADGADGKGSVAKAAAAVAEEEEGPRRAIPFMREVEAATGIDWFQVIDDTAPSSTPADSAPVAVGTLPPLEQDGSLRFYWLDAYEDELHAPGSVYLFGKVAAATGGWASCCVQLKGCERNAFVLPRATTETGEEVTFVQVFQEVSEICRKAKIGRFGCKKVRVHSGWEMGCSTSFAILAAHLASPFTHARFCSHPIPPSPVALRRTCFPLHQRTNPVLPPSPNA
jgi:hypothetical protein